MDTRTYGGHSGGGMFTCDGKLAAIEFANRALDGKPEKTVGVSTRVIREILWSIPPKTLPVTGLRLKARYKG